MFRLILNLLRKIKPKSRKKKAASSNEEMTKVPNEIIDEINRENSNIEMLKNATGRKEEKKPKSIDEIVKDASEDKPNEKKADKSKLHQKNRRRPF